MAYTDQQAIEELCKHFSRRTAEAIVDEIGAKAVFEGAGPAMADSGKAQAHAQSFGHTPEVAAKIVKRVGPHIVLAHAALNPDPTSSFWDPRFGTARATAAARSGPRNDQ